MLRNLNISRSSCIICLLTSSQLVTRTDSIFFGFSWASFTLLDSWFFCIVRSSTSGRLAAMFFLLLELSLLLELLVLLEPRVWQHIIPSRAKNSGFVLILSRIKATTSCAALVKAICLILPTRTSRDSSIGLFRSPLLPGWSTKKVFDLFRDFDLGLFNFDLSRTLQLRFNNKMNVSLFQLLILLELASLLEVVSITWTF